jgi:RimJ/RimL family protein N-acetyltransferase
MDYDVQTILENDKVILYPLLEKDFEDLYNVAADPKIWEQHPNKDRWKKEVFKTFFEGAIKSEGAFKIIDKTDGKVIGSTRYYDYSREGKQHTYRVHILCYPLLGKGHQQFC